MIVVADASPLNYLVQIGLVEETLPKLYGAVLLPETVLKELSQHAAPAEVKAWAANRPNGSA